MPEIIFVNPAEQPSGGFRLLDWLESNFENPKFTNFNMAVAFAKIGPCLKLDDKIKAWKNKGNSIEAIFGIDHKGTSYQALKYALQNFNHTYILHANYSTFHPKLYLFYGDNTASFFYGSNNLTPGGTETNFEGGILMNLNITDDTDVFTDGISCFNSMLPQNLSCCSEINIGTLLRLYKAGMLLNETKQSTSNLPKNNREIKKSEYARKTLNDIFGKHSAKPPRPIQKNIFKGLSTKSDLTNNNSTTTTVTKKIIPVSSLVIQIVPQHNGEVYLSKIAINQNPAFFGFPFTGKAVPKFSSNPPYSQRIPDPIVNIDVFDFHGNLIKSARNYSLNTIFYERNSELRITISQEILTYVPDYSILVMKQASFQSPYDYDFEIYCPGSIQYNNYLSSCNQELPSGGKPIARKMGWL